MVTLIEKFMKPAGLLILAGIIITLLIWTRPDTQAELQPLALAKVLTVDVRQMNIHPVTRITGKLQPARKATLRFEVSGNVTHRNIEPGQQVAKGDVLLQVDDRDFLDAVAEAQALLVQEQDAVRRDGELLALTSAAREIQEREVERLNKLGKESLASQSNYDESVRLLIQQQEEETHLQYSVGSAESRLQIRRSALNKAQRNLQRSRLIAPYASTVNAVYVEEGDYISVGQVALELVQLDTLDLYIEVTGEVANQLELGQEVNITARGQQYSGKIYAIAVDPDPVTHTHALRIRLSATDLYPGQLATTELPGKKLTNVAVIPVSAILQEEGQAYVFAVNKNNRLVRYPVELIARQQDLQVINGVSAGIPVVVKDVAVLADGQEVQVH
jgi:RND family efflux transporter MFP subunit